LKGNNTQSESKLINIVNDMNPKPYDHIYLLNQKYMSDYAFSLERFFFRNFTKDTIDK